MKIEKLLKDYSFTNEREYYDMIVESMSNGQYAQTKVQFMQLAKEQRVEFLRKLAKDIFDGAENRGLLHSTLMVCLNQIY